MNKALEDILHKLESLPQVEQERILRLLEAEVEKAQREAATSGRWARLAERLRQEAEMAGKSEKFFASTRDKPSTPSDE